MSTITPETICPWEWQGQTFHKGDLVKIDGEDDTFAFHYAETLKSGKIVVHVYHERWRAFYAERIKVIPAGTCPEHPKYQGIRRPRSGCGGCWAAWRDNHPEEAAS